MIYINLDVSSIEARLKIVSYVLIKTKHFLAIDLCRNDVITEFRA